MATALYRAKPSYKKAKNNLKETQMHVHNALLKGDAVVLPANLNGLPDTLKEHLTEVKPQVKEVKEDVATETKTTKKSGGK
jgi:hypothetical protein